MNTNRIAGELVESPTTENRGWVIYHPEMGVFLGECLGFGWWSNLDPVGQEAAVVFATDDEAAEYVRHINGVPIESVTFHSVEIDTRDGFASIASCERAGLPAWDPGN